MTIGFRVKAMNVHSRSEKNRNDLLPFLFLWLGLWWESKNANWSTSHIQIVSKTHNCEHIDVHKMSAISRCFPEVCKSRKFCHIKLIQCEMQTLSFSQNLGFHDSTCFELVQFELCTILRVPPALFVIGYAIYFTNWESFNPIKAIDRHFSATFTQSHALFYRAGNRNNNNQLKSDGSDNWHW